MCSCSVVNWSIFLHVLPDILLHFRFDTIIENKIFCTSMTTLQFLLCQSMSQLEAREGSRGRKGVWERGREVKWEGGGRREEQ